MPSVEHLKILVAVVECDSLSQAAERLYKTQPAVSAAIKQMESLLGIALFNRDGYRLQLNEQGRAIYEKAKIALGAHNDLMDTAHHFGDGHEAKVVLVIEASFELQKILPTLEAAQSKFPDTKIVIIQKYISGALELLGEGKADLAISPLVPTTDSGPNENRFLLEGNLINVATPKLLARHPSLENLKQLVSEYQVVVQDSGTGTEGMDLGVQSAQRRWYVNDFSTKLTLIESGMGWGRLPGHLVKAQVEKGSLVKIELEDFPSVLEVDYNLVRRSDRGFGPVATYLWSELNKLRKIKNGRN